MKKLGCIILFVCLFYHSPLNGQEISLKAAFDTTRILVGDQVNFSVMIDQPADLKLTLPFFKDSLTKNIEILSGPAIDTSGISGNKIRITEKYLVTSFDSGYYRIDPVFAEIVDSKGLKRYFSDYSYLEVARVKIAPADTSAKIYDIAAPYRAPLTLGEILPWILLAVLVSAIIWLIVKLIRKFKRVKKDEIVPAITEPAHVIAFRELEKLKNEKLWQNGETKKYYIRLTEIIRQYLENRFGVNSLELTTSETLEALIKTGFKKDESFNKLRSVLTGADLVKFAKYKPDPAENESVYSNSYDFVSATKAEEVIEEKSDVKDNQGEKGI
jgi:large-conductance mechanosensitive channel